MSTLRVMKYQPVSTSPPLRVGVLLPSRPAKWIQTTLAEMANACHARVVAVVTIKRESDLGALPWWRRAWTSFDQRLFEHRERRTNRQAEVGRSGDIVSPPLPLACATPEELSAQRLDVMVNFTSLVPTEFLTCARYGLWSFDSAGPGRAFEELYDDAVPTVTLRRYLMNDTQVIYHGSFLSDPLSLLRNRLADEFRRSGVLLRALADLHARGTELASANFPEKRQDATVAPVVGKVGDTSFLRWMARWSRRVLRRTLSRLAYDTQWQIAYRTRPEELDSAGSNQFRFLQPPTGFNYADPFAFEQNDTRYIFFERWADHVKGEIWCVALDERNQAGQPMRVLARPYHLSFPYVFAWRGETYMLPETGQNCTLELYRATDFPLKWERCAVLMEDEVVDSSIFEYEGRWWMFTSGLGGSAFKYSELSLFWAESPFGPWHPHPLNPVVCDVRCGRPAGAVFIAGGELIRPGQNCSRGYGYGITLNRIEVLSTTEYREMPVKTIKPNFARNACGVHTLNRSATLELLDFGLHVCRYRMTSNFPSSQLANAPCWIENRLNVTR